MKKTILTAVLFAMTLTLTACGGGGGSSAGGSTTTQPVGTSPVPPGADPATWHPTATINTMSLVNNTYATSTPGSVAINYSINVETTPSNGIALLHAGLSNTTIVTGVCETAPVTNQYQNLGASSASNIVSLPTYKVTNQLGVMTTATSNQNNQMIMATPVNGIDYTLPTYIVLTLCVPDMSRLPVAGVQPYSFSQISAPITITP